VKGRDLSIDVAIVGAGPYGLSLASHLCARGIGFRIFGQPMQSWRAHMPAGMRLKSEAFATSLSDPSGCFTLERYCVNQGLAFGDTAAAIPLHVFVAYGLAFQHRFVPEIDERSVVSITKDARGFLLALDDGEAVSARCVLVAVGLYCFRHLPGVLSGLPPDVVSHSADHAGLDAFSHRRVTVIGAGSSAVELATLLHEKGVDVRLVTRRQGPIQYQVQPAARAKWQRALRPLSGIGYGWHSKLIAGAPQLFRFLPSSIRPRVVDRYLMPAPGWFVRDRFQGQITHLSGCTLESLSLSDSGVELRMRHVGGGQASVMSDHVIAATGYRLDLRRLSILSPELLHGIRQIGGQPELSGNFESSVPGLYFLGPLSSNCFGPAMRFVLGADFTARTLTRHLSHALGRPVRLGAAAHRKVASTMRVE
jgi:hypothetical protein